MEVGANQFPAAFSCMFPWQQKRAQTHTHRDTCTPTHPPTHTHPTHPPTQPTHPPTHPPTHIHTHTHTHTHAHTHTHLHSSLGGVTPTEVVTGSCLRLCRAEVQSLQVLSCSLSIQVRQGDQPWYPMTVVASLSAVPQSGCTPLHQMRKARSFVSRTPHTQVPLKG